MPNRAFTLSLSTKSLILPIILALCVPAMATSVEPQHVPPEICHLAVARHPSGDVLVTWSGGTAPFTVIRSPSPVLTSPQDREGSGPVLAIATGTASRTPQTKPVIQVVASNVQSRHVLDRDVAKSSRRWYYQVYDRHSAPVVLGFAPDGGLPGSWISVHGAALVSDCNLLTVKIAGVEAKVKRRCTFTGFDFQVPANMITGSLIVATPAGASIVGDMLDYCNGKPRQMVSW